MIRTEMIDRPAGAGPARRTIAALAAGGLLLLSACSSGDAGEAGDTGTSASGQSRAVVFSPPSMSIPIMQDIADQLERLAAEQGYELLLVDPDNDALTQATELQTLVESGRVDGVIATAIQPSSLANVVETAQANGIAMVLNGTPSAYGLSGLVPGISFNAVSYENQGTILGEELAACIEAKLDGQAKVILVEAPAGSSGKDELESAAKGALAANAPDAEISATVVTSDRAGVQTDVGNVLQGLPDAAAVLATSDEGALGALGGFDAAGKELACVVSSGGNDEVVSLIDEGRIYAAGKIAFDEDAAQSFENLVEMIDDPDLEGRQLDVPQVVIKGEG